MMEEGLNHEGSKSLEEQGKYYDHEGKVSDSWTDAHLSL